MTPQDIVNSAVLTLDSKKAQDITVLDVGELTSLGDFFVIASGSSSTQVKALAQEVEAALRKQGKEPFHTEGRGGNAQWLLLDYGSVLVHIFYNETRDFYSLERLWADAPQQNVDEILAGM